MHMCKGSPELMCSLSLAVIWEPRGESIVQPLFFPKVVAFTISAFLFFCFPPFTPGGRVLPYMGYIDMCHYEGYGFQAIHSSIGYTNQSI